MAASCAQPLGLIAKAHALIKHTAARSHVLLGIFIKRFG